MYINPIPMVDAGKDFEMRLSVSFDDVTELGEAKRRAAQYLLRQDEKTLASWLHCTNIKPVYPENMKNQEAAENNKKKEKGNENGQ